MELEYWTPTSNLNSSKLESKWIKMDNETSAGRQSTTIEQPTKEIERNGTTSVSYKLPTAYKTLNQHQIWLSEENLSSPELLLSSLFSPSLDTKCMDSISTWNGLFHLNLPRIPRFLQYPAPIRRGVRIGRS